MATRIDELPEPDFVEKHIVQEPVPTNIQTTIKKQVSFAGDVATAVVEEKKSFLQTLQEELNEDNLLLLLLLITACHPMLNSHIGNIPFIGAYATSDITTSVIKAVLLFLLYIFAKSYLIPKVKL
jgi:hypothetical protein